MPQKNQSTSVSKAESESLLLNFLDKHGNSWYNTKRILVWATQQPGFEHLQDLSYQQIDHLLSELATNNQILSKPSEKGDWKLYRANKPVAAQKSKKHE